MNKPHLPLIMYPGWLPLVWQIKIANFNIWINQYLSVEFTHKWSTHGRLKRYYREQEEKQRIRNEQLGLVNSSSKETAQPKTNQPIQEVGTVPKEQQT